MSTAASPVPRLRHPWALAIGAALILPQVVLAVLVVQQPIVVGLISFAMTIGWIRLGTLTYRVARERPQPLHRGLLAVVGLSATILGAWLFLSTTAAARAAADPTFTGVIAPPGAIGLNLLVIASSGVYVCGLVLLVGAAVGAVQAAFRR